MVRTTATDQAEAHSANFWLGPRIANYNLQGSGVAAATTGNVAAAGSGLGNPTLTDAQPSATITDVIIRAISGDGAITLGADELHVYTFAVS